MSCATCGKPCEGYKCDSCGAEMETVDLRHSCGIDHCKPMCTGCNQPENKCNC